MIQAVLGLKLTGVLFGGAMAGIILGFASQSIVGNFIAGIFLIIEKPIALKRPEPLVYVDNLGDNAVNIMVRIWMPVSEWYELKQVMLWKIKITLEQAGIEIAFSQRTLWFAN